MICKRCGKEFKPKTFNQVYCCGDCYYLAAQERNTIKIRIRSVAKKHNFEIKNLDKIVRAKMLLFKGKNKHYCPCKADDKEKYCGSSKCLTEIHKKGHCCCGLFHKKDSTNE